MSSEFAEVLKAYLEIGVLGICAVTLIAILVFVIKRIMSSYSSKDKNQQDLNTKLVDMLAEQNKELTNFVQTNNKTLVEDVVHAMTTHVPSQEENTRQTQINESIDKILRNVLDETKADRASLVQYHNGGLGVNKQRFLKMSMTNEEIKSGNKPMISNFKDQFRSVLGMFISEINEKGECAITDAEDIKDTDPSLYAFMKDRNIEAKLGVAVYNADKMVIGFICLEFNHKEDLKPKSVLKILREHHAAIEALLQM